MDSKDSKSSYKGLKLNNFILYLSPYVGRPENILQNPYFVFDITTAEKELLETIKNEGEHF